MRLALALLAFSLPALAAPPCDGPEPKDVACRIWHDPNTQDPSDIRYEWTADNVSPFLCATRTTSPAYRPGRQARPAATWFNPYAFDGQCFPAAGVTRVYRVRACWVSTGICSVNWSNPVTVIGVPAAEMRCCTPAGCGPC